MNSKQIAVILVILFSFCFLLLCACGASSDLTQENPDASYSEDQGNVSGWERIIGKINAAMDSFANRYWQTYETSSIEDYGYVFGWTEAADKLVKEDFANYFPSEIKNSYADVHYHFFQSGPDAVSYEIFLSFIIPDPDEFRAYVATITDEKDFRPFPYDERYLEYLPVRNGLDLESVKTVVVNGEERVEYYSIGSAIIERTLIQPEEQQIVIVALRVSDGGGSRTSSLGYFFSFFGIDPSKLAEDLGAE